MVFRSGPKRVEKAFGMFDKALKKLGDAKELCRFEADATMAERERLEVKYNDIILAASRADVAITNIKTLIGE